MDSLEMADLLRRLESGLHRVADASQWLTLQVDRIDKYMCTQRIINPNSEAQQDSSAVINTESLTGQGFQPEENSVPPYNHEPTTADYGDHLSLFQLPQELLEDWPWPFDSMQTEGMFPLGFE